MMKYLRQRSGWSRAWSRLRWMMKRLAWQVVVRSASFVKRVFDVVVSLLAIIVLSPVFLLTWLAIKLEDGGPALFVQQRVGRHGKLFPMYKFRSMVVDAEKIKAQLMDKNESGGGVLFKMKNDPRVTRVGRVIRKYSIDELPQLFNVLKGDMSLVGPRPALPSEVAKYSVRDRMRLEVRPGLTCLWQIGGRSDIDFEGQVRLDVQYIREQGFWNDVKILLKTIPAVLLGKGAY
ncbi:MAG: sugar transferase [Zetaproteobacteria bacterium]|nr:MAG: sugar transferase [Zetaproteobacteria bacterium]